MKEIKQSSFSHLFIISGPSGVGKGTIMGYLVDKARLRKIVNYTTRPCRPKEVEGIDYHFVSKEVFFNLISSNNILEAEKVYGDYYYGSPRLFLDSSSDNCIIELDTHGASRYKKEYGNNTTSIFILPPSVDELINRIIRRYSESNLNDRILTAAKQLDCASEYDYIIVNDDLPFACSEANAIILTTNNSNNRSSSMQLLDTIKNNLLRNIQFIK